ncbi:MAG: hypothetical protein FD155_2397 [Bacteroidetes bacterium]|nr:MAG: hypothetical protein FD155_2397 [Bacteroidota bacterium]
MNLCSNFVFQSTFKMNKEKDYIKDLAEIRQMMERSSKFISLSGWAGILAGIYALVAAYIAYTLFNFKPGEESSITPSDMLNVILLALALLVLALTTAVFLSYKSASKRSEPIWNATSRRLLLNMAVPLVTGGIFLIIMISQSHFNMLSSISLIFYGLALYNAGNFTYKEVKILGVILIILGLISACFISWALLIWAAGFGLMHIVYGIYIQVKYKR